MGSAADSSNLALSRMAIGGTVIAGAAFIGLGALSVKMAADFQQSMTLLVTSAGESQNNLKMVGDGILAMSVQTATSTDKLATAMFTVESAGYHGAAGLKVLQAAAEGAKIENADLAQVTDALTTTMHDWREPANQAIDVMNSFREAASIGKMRMDDFTGAMRTVGPVASLAKIPLTDIEAALSTMSLEGDKGASAGTHLAQSLLNMIAPSTKAQAVLKEIGLTAQQVSDDMQKSLPDTLKEITDDIGKKFPKGSEAYNHALSDMFGGTRGLKAILELTGQNLKDFTNDAADLAPIMKQNATNVDGWSQVQQNFNFKLEAAVSAVQALVIKAGTQLLPIFGKLLDAVTPLITAFADWIDKNNAITNAFNATVSGVQSVTNWYNQWHTAISSTTTLLTAFFIPAIIASGVQAVIAAGKIAFNFVAAIVASGAEAWGAVFKIATYVGVLIATGAQAIVSATAVTTKFVVALIATAIQAGITASTMYGGIIPALYATGASAVSTAAGLIVKLVPALGATGVASSAALGPLGLLAAGLIGLGFALKYAIDSAEKMNKQVSFNVDDMSTKNIQTVDRMRLHLNASTDQMVHGVTQDTSKMAADAAANARQMEQNVTVAAQTMAANTLAALGDVAYKGGQSFAQLLSQVDIDMASIDATAKQYWADVMGYIENNPIVGHVTYTTAGGGVGVQQSPTTGHNAGGTDNWSGGWSWVGEKGPELMNIPRGAQIIPHDRSVAAASGGGPINLHVDVYLDGTRMTGQLMPRIVQQVRQATGVRF